MITFQSSRERIHRADEHWSAFKREWLAALENRTYELTYEIQGDGTGAIRVDLVRALPPILSVELGEMLYQLRAALDACVYQAACLDAERDPPPNEQALEFPICTKAIQWESSAAKIAPLDDRRKRIIENVQPYNIDRFRGTARVIRSLAILNDWARKDRHRRLHVMRAVATRVVQPRLDPDGPLRFVEWSPRPPHVLEDDPVVATFTLAGWVPGAKFNPQRTVRLEVAVNEPPARSGDGDTLDRRVREMFFAVRWMAEEFEESFALPYPIRKFRAPQSPM